MPNTRISFASSVEIKTLRRSPRFCTLTATPQQPQFPATRRSLRFLQKNDIPAPTLPELPRSHRQVHSSKASLEPSQNASLKTPKSVPAKTAKESSKSGVVSSKNEGLSTGSKKSSAFENGFEGIQIPRRYTGVSSAAKIEKAVEGRKARVSKSSSINLKNPSPGVRRSPRLNNGVWGNPNFSSQQEALDKGGRNTGKSRGENVAKRESRKGNSEVDVAKSKCGGTQVVEGEMKKKLVATGKRKREEDVAIRQGWTKEQEVALNIAYYAAKPTPKFWKKVSKLVPGKSAQDCFDKVHSDHMTPPQPRPRSRRQSTKSSQIENLTISEGKLLNLGGAKPRKSSCKNRKSHNAQKTVRLLLENNYQGALSCEADFFSQLEPNINLSHHSPQPSKELSSTKDLLGTPVFLHERSLPNHKKPLSRFSSSVEAVVVSPPVLKQVKNRSLHEKYIDHLHHREAKRKSLSKCVKNHVYEEKVSNEGHAARTNDLRAARNALISDARNAIHQLRDLHANATSDDLDFDGDDDCNVNVDYESEDET